MKSFIGKITIVGLLTCILASSYSCKVGMVSESKGKAQEAFLQLIESQTKYPDGVQVGIDENAPFVAKVNKETKMGVRGDVYVIPTGRHRVKIMVDGRTIYNREIFTSSQETKQIQIP
jgi:hypothetical protein